MKNKFYNWTGISWEVCVRYPHWHLKKCFNMCHWMWQFSPQDLLINKKKVLPSVHCKAGDSCSKDILNVTSTWNISHVWSVMLEIFLLVDISSSPPTCTFAFYFLFFIKICFRQKHIRKSKHMYIHRSKVFLH